MRKVYHCVANARDLANYEIVECSLYYNGQRSKSIKPCRTQLGAAWGVFWRNVLRNA